MRGLLIGSLLLVSVGFSASTYPIVEPDLWEEMQAKMQRAQEKLKKEQERIGKALEKGEVMKSWWASLPMPEKSYTYEVSMLYTLEQDIPRVNEKGQIVGVLYPKGYTFNPLHYIAVDPPTLIVFDGKDKRQVEFVKKLLPSYPYRMLISSQGGVFDLMKGFRERVFLLNPVLREKLKLRHGVSVVKWDRNKGTAVVEVYGCDKVGCGTASKR